MEETVRGATLHLLSQEPIIFKKATQADQSSIFQFQTSLVVQSQLRTLSALERPSTQVS